MIRVYKDSEFSMRRKAIFFALLCAAAIYIPQAQAQDAFYSVTCQPTEESDMKVSIRRKIFERLNLEKSIREKVVAIRVQPIKKVEVRSLSELTSGTTISIDPLAPKATVSGDLLGHACLVDASVTITISAKNKTTGEQMVGETTRSMIRVPGNWAVKRKLTDEEVAALK